MKMRPKWKFIKILAISAILSVILFPTKPLRSQVGKKCVGFEHKLEGHVLVMPNNKGPLTPEYRKYLIRLPSEHGVLYAGRVKNSRVLPFSFYNVQAEPTFKALTANVESNAKIETILKIDLLTPPLSQVDSIHNLLNGTVFQKILSKTLGSIKFIEKWSDKDETGDLRLFFHLIAGNHSLVFGIRLDSNCTSYQIDKSPAPPASDDEVDVIDSDESDKNEDHSPSVPQDNPDRPDDKPMVFPLRDNFPSQMSYFFGPRLMESWAQVPKLESGNLVFHPSRQTPYNVVRRNWDAHPGIDIVGMSGGSIRNQDALSPFDGVIFSKVWHRGCGNVLIIRHEVNVDGKNTVVYSRYLHLATQSNRKIGEKVKAGDVVGKVGNTGTYSSGFHLHFELRIPKGLDINTKGNQSSQSRFNAVFTQTSPVNSADYIASVEHRCRDRKGKEFSNAQKIEKNASTRVGIMTAGLCSQDYEEGLKDKPKIYKIKSVSDIPKVYGIKKS